MSSTSRCEYLPRVVNAWTPNYYEACMQKPFTWDLPSAITSERENLAYLPLDYFQLFLAPLKPWIPDHVPVGEELTLVLRYMGTQETKPIWDEQCACMLALCMHYKFQADKCRVRGEESPFHEIELEPAPTWCTDRCLTLLSCAPNVAVILQSQEISPGREDLSYSVMINYRTPVTKWSQVWPTYLRFMH